MKLQHRVTTVRLNDNIYRHLTKIIIANQFCCWSRMLIRYRKQYWKRDEVKQKFHIFYEIKKKFIITIHSIID